MNESKTKGRASANDVPPVANGSATGGGWTKIQTDHPIWKPDSDDCGVAQGYVLGRVTLPKPTGGTWDAFVIRASAVTTCLLNDEVVKVPVGKEFLIGVAVKLQAIDRFIRPDVLIEIRVKDLGKIDIGNGKTMRRFEVEANKDTTKPRLSLDTVAQPALPKASDDVPF